MQALIPLELLLVMVVLGVALVVGLTHVGGGSRGRPLSEAEALACFQAEYPEAGLTKVVVDTKGGVALLWGDGPEPGVVRSGEKIGVVLAFGWGRVVRLLGPGDVRGVEGTVVRLRDPGLPEFRVELGGDWAERLLALREEGGRNG